MSKRILSAALALALSLSLAVPAFAEEEGPFDDVPLDHWAVEAIRQAKEEAIISGMYYRNFAPDDRLTTAQFATIVTKAFYWRDFGRDPEESWIAPGEGEEDWYVFYKEVAERAGLTEGTGIEDWNAPMTRYQMAVMLYNVVVDKELALPDKAVLEAVEITDWDQVPEEFQEAVSTAYAMGLLSGMEDGSFAGDQTLTRAQAAVVFAKLDKAMEVKDGLLERALDKEERYYTRYSFLSYSFSRYPGELGTACVATQGGLPHGGQTSMVFIYQDGSVLNIDMLLPPGYRLSGIGGYLNPSKIRFNETGDKLTFVTPIEEGIPSKPGDGSTGIWAEYKDWGPTLCTVDLISGTMESLEPVRYSEYWDIDVEQGTSVQNTSDYLTVTLAQESGKEDLVVQESNIPFAGIRVSPEKTGVYVYMPDSLLADPDFQASEFGQAVQQLRDMNLPEYSGRFDTDPPAYSEEELETLREQAAQYVQVAMNGVPFPGDIWVAPLGEGTQVLYFWLSDRITDRNLRCISFLDGDTLTVRIGLPQE